MANPFYNPNRQIYNSNQQNNNGFFGLIQQFNQFRANFQGDPRERVQQLLNTGQMSQEQFNRFSEMARTLQNTFFNNRF